ncbi:hypothetical protein C8029_04790 [Roseobacter sp. TSBP12]|nr:hypothetical protein C8029_04790 [Roseobacter sp. TSBP12]|tara:strand:+ start:10317 stop:10496 length:180 start_codon:yes stop_codon:yes gene_type:complete
MRHSAAVGQKTGNVPQQGYGIWGDNSAMSRLISRLSPKSLPKADDFFATSRLFGHWLDF